MMSAQLFQAMIASALLAIRVARGVCWQGSGERSAGFVHQFSYCRKHLCHTPKSFARIDLIVDIPRLRDGIQDAGTKLKKATN